MLPPPEAGQVIVLKPGQIHSIRVSFDDPHWSVIKEEKSRSEKGIPLKLVDLSQDWSARFRLEYRPPERALGTNVPNSKLIWQGRLPSRAFNAVGSFD